jgi:hypothetical protein
VSSVTYLEAVVMGALQGVSELFPVSSLGHSVLLPALIGGRWARDLSVTAKESPYLAVLVAMHVATALALVLFFWRDWVRIVNGLISSIRHRRIDSADERLACLLVIATVPVGPWTARCAQCWADRSRRPSSSRSTVSYCWPQKGCVAVGPLEIIMVAAIDPPMRPWTSPPRKRWSCPR